MSTQDRLGAALDRLATGTGVLRSRAYDTQRAEQNGTTREERLEAVVIQLEGAADQMWSALDKLPELKKVA